MTEQLRNAVFDKADDILSACIHCWNDVDVYRAREYFSTTLGVFSYQNEDRERLERQIKTDEFFQADDSQRDSD